MINFYKKSFHSLLWLKDTVCSKSKIQQGSEEHGLGLGLISHNNLKQSKSPNILQSSSLLITKPLSPPTNHSGPVAFIDHVGSSVDGLTSCTESLGFESYDERLLSDDSIRVEDGGGCTLRTRRRTVVERRFPPPLTTLNQHGQPNFYLRPMRKDGRLELTEFRIERTEILRACRGDGRLRLHLIKNERCGIEEEGEEKKQVEGVVKEEKMELRRCVEVVNQQRRREHHPHNLDVWRQHCVTTS